MNEKKIIDVLRTFNIKNMTGGDIDNFDKIMRERILEHKLMTNSFSSAKKCECKEQTCNKCKTKETIKKNFKNEYNQIALPQLDYIECLASKVKNAIDEKQKETPLSKYLLTGSQYRYNNYISSTAYSPFVNLFFNLFFNDIGCVFPDISSSNIHYIPGDDINSSQLKYIADLFEIIDSCNRDFFITDLDVPGHANSLIIDKKNKKIYRFEPNGSRFLLGTKPHILLEDWFIENGEYTHLFIDAFMNNKKLDLSQLLKDKVTIDSS